MIRLVRHVAAPGAKCIVSDCILSLLSSLQCFDTVGFAIGMTKMAHKHSLQIKRFLLAVVVVVVCWTVVCRSGTRLS